MVASGVFCLGKKMAGVFSVLMWNAQRDRGSQTGKTSEWLRFSPCIRGGKIRLILPIKNPQHPLSDIWICLLLLFFFLWTESAPLSKSDTSPQFPCVCACVCVSIPGEWNPTAHTDLIIKIAHLSSHHISPLLHNLLDMSWSSLPLPLFPLCLLTWD